MKSDPGDDARLTAHAAQARTDRLGWSAQWGAASRWPGSAFSFVEAAGLGYVAKLGQWLIPDKKDRAAHALERAIGNLQDTARREQAERMLDKLKQ